MLQQAEIIEILLRGINVGASLMIAGAMLAGRLSARRLLGALFSLATAAYVVVSSDPLTAAIGPLAAPARILAMYAPILFWWFALSLFDDGFAWRPAYFIPIAVGVPFILCHFLNIGGVIGGVSFLAFRLAQLFAYAHAIYIALKFAPDDLVEGRRRFRVVFAVTVALTGIVIVAAETALGANLPEAPLLIFQAAAILALTFALGLWLIDTRKDVLDGPPEPPVSARGPVSVAGADRPAFDSLMRLMAEGAYREEGLSVAGLAAKVGVPEHHLRRLINRELGHRNFPSFVNSWRIDEAKRFLSDPAQARRQVLQIALDVGYGSIAPFNRAFKEATGKTPTEFRKAARGEAPIVSENL